jgi:hypothetical protein
MRENHVVYSDVKHLGGGPSLCTSVVFHSVDEIDHLIAALTYLRDNADDPDAHFHLQHYELGKKSSVEETEVTFHGPASERGTLILERDQLAENARRFLTIR